MRESKSSPFLYPEDATSPAPHAPGRSLTPPFQHLPAHLCLLGREEESLPLVSKRITGHLCEMLGPHTCDMVVSAEERAPGLARLTVCPRPGHGDGRWELAI